MRSIRQFFSQGAEILSMIRGSMSDAPDAWEFSIRQFEAWDRACPPLAGAIVFTGSSSITFWKTLEQDMAPLPVINRGFGGSRMCQVVHYASRVVVPYRPRAVVLFAGTNDISGPHPKTARQVSEGYLAFVRAVHADLPKTTIYYISITPAPSRWKYWPIVCEANQLIQAHTATGPRLHFIDITGRFLGPDGRPRRELYRMDRLHPNALGYVQWTAAIKPVLLADLG